MSDKPNLWREAIDAALAENAERGEKPDSLRTLAAELAAAPGAPTMESWSSSLKRYRRADNPQLPRETNAQAIAAALKRPRSAFPAAQSPQTVSEVADLLERLEAEVDAIRAELPQRNEVAHGMLAKMGMNERGIEAVGLQVRGLQAELESALTRIAALEAVSGLRPTSESSAP